MDSQRDQIEEATARGHDLCSNMLAGRVIFSQVDNGVVEEAKAALERMPLAKQQVRDEMREMTRRAEKLEERTAGLKGDDGKFDLQKYLRAAEKVKQKEFDHILHLVLMNEDQTLDRLRKMSPEHKAALLNLEKELAERKWEEKCKEADEKLEEARRELRELRDLREAPRRRRTMARLRRPPSSA